MLNSPFIKVLKIDLTSRRFQIEEREDLIPYLGGVGVAMKLLDEEIDYNQDPLDPCQPIIFAIGALSTIYPVITKTVCAFYSPLTGNLGESYAGGRLAMALLYSGYHAVIIKGRADRPVYITIGSRDVRIKNADPLWGTTVEEAGRYLREKEGKRGVRSILRIGPAGEKMVRFAGINVDTYRHFGRLGAGAVFGSKNLKALVVSGDNYYPIPEPHFKTYRQVYREIYKQVTSTEIMEKYHGLGTPANVLPLNDLKALPTRNLTAGSFEFAEELSGEAFAEETLVRKMACVGCPVGCIHIGQYRTMFDQYSHEYASNALSYDYEPIYALGSFIGTRTKAEFFRLLEKVENYGLDALSTGVLMGWMTEAYQNSLLKEEEIGTSLDFGYTEGYLKVIENLIHSENDLYQTLRLGVEAAASRYGGLDYAMALGRHEMTGYHTGYGAVLGQAVGARHSHLDNAGYAVDQKYSIEDRDQFVDAIFHEEVMRCLLNSLIICLFARNVYTMETIEKAFQAIGRSISKEELSSTSRRILKLKLEIKTKMGFDFRKLRFPRRFFETEYHGGRMDPQIMQDLLNRYIMRVEKLMQE
ncbi:aldehyde:ferredoxin oxidoreductase [Thermosyntropha lipolytica DSM 11003]|uniref:Aldehyde:ferredoxin oxidoreductase n=1 Tax=Thermosyntropha lipolytica DSM 11003 TaxID=1123382 RepID=A0A1M5Q7J9_9FIRM|nr:aldehyde ferredoxin oxidoreductase N-terminal domain-containing protein [Thermosyntropha lipolytica]SHH09443.1 aldehyde:ferredoxin oxidoreductase [Thermosyntropha lipolytica DSM 11003]